MPILNMLFGSAPINRDCALALKLSHNGVFKNRIVAMFWHMKKLKKKKRAHDVSL